MSLFHRLFSRNSQKSYNIAMEAYNRGEFDTAAESFLEVLDSASRGSPVYILSRFFVTRCRVQLGHALHESGRSQEARDVLQIVVKDHPEFPDVHFRLGQIAESRDLDREAEMRFVRAIEINDRYLEPRLSLVQLCRRNDRPTDAAEHARALADVGVPIPERWLSGEPGEDTAEEIEAARVHVGNSSRSHEHFEDALRAYHEGDLGRSLDGLTRAVKDAPRHPDLRCRRGTVLGELGRFDEAVHEFSEAVSLNPSYEEARIKRGVTYFQLGRCAEAAEDFDKLVQDGTSNSEILLLLGASLMRSGRVAEAIPHLREARSDESASARATYFLAQAYLQMDRADSAIECLESSRNPTGLALLGRLYLRQSRIQDAVRVLGRARAGGDTGPDVVLALAIAHRILGDSDRALKYAEEAMEAEGTWNQAAILLAEITLDRGEDEKALEWLTRLRSGHGMDYEAHVLQGRAMARLQRDIEAETALGKALDIRPDGYEARRALGLLLRRMGDAEEGNRLLAEARRTATDPLWAGQRDPVVGGKMAKAA